MIRNILIFEPWNLGDLIIATNFARFLNREFGMRIWFICKPLWIEWLLSENFIEDVYAFEAPWTRIRGKYNPFNYKIKEIYKLSGYIKQVNPELIWDVRGDIRQKLFLKAITKKRIYSPKYPKNINVYERLSFFVRDNIGITNVQNFKYPEFENAKSIGVITIFIDSAWPNKRVPPQKAYELITNLLYSGYFVKLIIPPDKDYEFAKELISNFPDKIILLKNSVVKIADEIKNSDLVISTDSGWLHMAYYYGVPRIGLFGFDNHLEWAPPGTKVILADKYLSKESRYKIKNMYLTPLESLDIKKVISEIENIKQSVGMGTNLS